MLLVMLLGAMPEDSGPGGLLLPSAKARATDFSIAAIMARGGGDGDDCGQTPPPAADSLPSDGEYTMYHFAF